MVEKIIINPNEVRGYGNILNPHSAEDYEPYLTTVTETTDTVEGRTMTVYEMEYEGNLTPTTLTLTVNSSSVYIGDTVTFTATLKDTSNNAVSGATVTFKEGSTSLGTGTTNSSGVATLSTTSLTVGSHSVTANYGGDSTYAGSNSSSVSVTVSHNYSLAFSSSSYTASGGSAEVSVTLTDNSVAVSGATVTFTGGTSTVTGTTNSSGVATATISVTTTSTITATYGTATDTCTITVGPSYIINDDCSSNHISDLFDSSIPLRNNGSSNATFTSGTPSYYLINVTTNSSDSFLPYKALEGITSSFRLTIQSSLNNTSNIGGIGLYYYLDSNNWGGVKDQYVEQWISAKTNGTFTENSYSSGLSRNTEITKKIIEFNATANTITISSYKSDDTLILSKTMNIPVTITSSVKWGTGVTWSTSDKHRLYNIKAEYI